ncbi:PepSY domain-containing protein [Rheinheimera soli]|uniref:Iron-regulated membrane protein n=1 Tax=Rheinheimera soli TaxID=443616 RepID=A0ABU1VYV1_9GAMM|nr:PepSY domain-containing protein [Rheinheimera soli]MDR7120906.1 putative iron-regulated membrane protein [Rheinheimera soli]
MDFLLRLAFWRKVHRYLGWVLGLQLICWFGSGLVMSVLPITEVRGEHLRKTFVAPDWSQTISPAALAEQHPEHQLKLSQQGAIPLYQFSKDEEQLYYSALTGGAVAPLTEAQVKDLVRLQYQGNAEIARIQRLQQAPFEVRHLTTPLWLVQFADESGSSFYLEEYSGKLLSVRTNHWRLFDFVWMLHIMDYEDRENFNHPLLIIFSATALFFTLSGALLLPWRRKKRADLQQRQANTCK